MDPIPIVFKLTTLTNRRADNELAIYINEKLGEDKELNTLLSDKAEVAEVQKRLVQIKHPLLLLDRVINLEVINPTTLNWHLKFEAFSKDYRCVEILPDRTFVCYETTHKKFIFIQTGVISHNETIEAFHG